MENTHGRLQPCEFSFFIKQQHDMFKLICPNWHPAMWLLQMLKSCHWFSDILCCNKLPAGRSISHVMALRARLNTKVPGYSECDEHVSICFIQCYLLRYKVLPATVIASLETFLLNTISLSLNWKEALSLSYHDSNTDRFVPRMKLFHHVLDFLFFFSPMRVLPRSIKSEVWILRFPRGRRCITTRMTSTHKLLEHTERPRHWSPQRSHTQLNVSCSVSFMSRCVSMLVRSRPAANYWWATKGLDSSNITAAAQRHTPLRVNNVGAEMERT